MSDVLEGLDEVIERPVAEPVIEEPSKEPEKKAEPAQPVEAAKAAPKEESRTIPLATYLEERKQHRSELDELRKELAALKNPPKEAPKPPEFVEDPKGWIDHRLNETVEQTKRLVEPVQQNAQQAAEQARDLQFLQALRMDQEQFARDNPDYGHALAHMRAMRAQELRVYAQNMGIAVTDEQVNERVSWEELQFARETYARGKKPPELAYSIAKAKGYVKKDATKESAEGVTLPEVKEPHQIAPDKTLGSASTDTGGESDSKEDEIDLALKSIFRRKSA